MDGLSRYTAHHMRQDESAVPAREPGGPPAWVDEECVGRIIPSHRVDRTQPAACIPRRRHAAAHQPARHARRRHAAAHPGEPHSPPNPASRAIIVSGRTLRGSLQGGTVLYPHATPAGGRQEAEDQYVKRGTHQRPRARGVHSSPWPRGDGDPPPPCCPPVLLERPARPGVHARVRALNRF